MTDETDDLEIDPVEDRTAMAERRREAIRQIQHNRNLDLLDEQRAAARIARNREKFIKLGLWVGK